MTTGVRESPLKKLGRVHHAVRKQNKTKENKRKESKRKEKVTEK
jgi:hypothetical protein